MKVLLVVIFIALLMIGRVGAQSQTSIKNKLFNDIDWDDEEARDSMIANAIEGSKLEERSENGENLIYVLEEQKPFTGLARHENSDSIGLITRVASLKEGKIEGLMIFRKNQGKLRKLRADNFKDGKMHGLSTEWYENGQKSLERNLIYGMEQGSWIRWYKDGTQALIATYKDGKQVGLSRAWYENGRRKSEISYKDGKVVTIVVWKPNGEKCPVTNVKGGNGVEAEYTENGIKPNRFSYSYKYKNGKKSWRNSCVIWHENGQMRREVSFLGDKRDGGYFEWYEEGQMRFKGNFKFGKKEGGWTEWHKNGEMKFQGNFKSGKRYGLWTGWYENGQKDSEGKFKGDQKDGWWAEWSASGQKLMEGNFKADKKDGLWTYWHHNGRKHSEESFRAGKLYGLSKGWDEEGRKETESNWKDGRIDGLFTRWYENGQKEGEATFRESKLYSVVVRKPDGKKCILSNVENGTGVWVVYDEKGTEESRSYYLNGKKVSFRLHFPNENEHKNKKDSKQGEKDIQSPKKFPIVKPI
jgi:antitoxin component YwqK of YwqJK toxin-antitoxin module